MYTALPRTTASYEPTPSISSARTTSASIPRAHSSRPSASAISVVAPCLLAHVTRTVMCFEDAPAGVRPHPEIPLRRPPPQRGGAEGQREQRSAEGHGDVGGEP